MPPTISLPKRPSHVLEVPTVLEGAGVPVRRALPNSAIAYELTDPFLLLDEASIPKEMDAAFPDHPHRGFEIVTYVLEGALLHTDSRGNRQRIEAGGIQLIRAGIGIVHGESHDPHAGNVRALQMWVNLPKALKQAEPEYRHISHGEIPKEAWAHGKILHLAGEGSSLPLAAQARYMDLSLEPNAKHDLEVPTGWQGFAYALEGGGTANGEPMRHGGLISLPQLKGVHLRAGEAGMRLVVGMGLPLREPIRWRGPFVD
jgi:redox-sensitive bicupin YhaK (pirin superfamily)